MAAENTLSRPGLPTWQQITTSYLARLDWAALLAFVLPFALYAFTLAPTIYNLDSAELTTAAATGGIVRATGYPLYVVLGHIWSYLPVGDVGYRMNLFSALWGAMTIFQLEFILRRLRVGPWARLGALGLLATAPYFWALSLIAEVYTLHTALQAAVILSLLRWGDRPTAARLVLPVFLMGLSLGNHMATVLLVPGCVAYVLVKAPATLRAPRVWLAAAAAALLGLSIYLYLPWRFAAAPDFNYAGLYDAAGRFDPVNLRTVDGFLWLVTGRSFAGQMFGYTLAEMGPELLAFGRQLANAFLGIGLLPGLLGMVVLGRRDWRVGGFFLLLFGLNVVFYVNYRVIDKNTMFLPAYVIWAIWLGAGYQQLLDWLREAEQRIDPRRPARGLLLGAVLLAAAWNGAHVSQRGEWETRTQSEAILEAVAPDAIVFGWWDTVPGAQYLQLVEGQRPDVLLVNRFLISAADMDELIRTQAGRRPIYINNPPLSMLDSMTVTPAGPVYRLQPRVETTGGSQ